VSAAAIVLAAGASRRFGDADKLLAPFAGKPLEQHAAEAVRGLDLVARIAVISSAALRPHFAGFDVVELADASGGQSASLRAGLARARALAPGRLLVVLADMPRVTPDLLRRVIETATAEMPAAATDGRRAMPPACFPAASLDLLARLDGDAGARAIIQALPPERLVRAAAGELLDVDRLADLDGLL
jgi:CTP:molybdopterin cytidylyltransferase MocA